MDHQQIEQWREQRLPHALIDVRERWEYAHGHIPGACPIPRGLLEINLPGLMPWTEIPVVLYSDGDHRSELAARTCQSLGYGRVHVLSGGLDRWSRESGRHPERGVNVIGKVFGERLAESDLVRQVDPAEVEGLAAEHDDVLVIDVRPADEYHRGHLPGAVNVPAGELVAHVRARDLRGESQAIVTHCTGRTRGIIGAYLLRAAGFEHASALRNGTMGWVMSGRRLESSRDEESPAAPGDARGVQPAVAATTATASTSSVPGPDVPGRIRRELANATSAGPITCEELTGARTADQPVRVIDVRQPAEFAAGHLPGSLLCPVGQLANAVDELLPVREARIVCVSSAEERSRIGSALLASIGYPRVSWLQGGVTGWTAAGRSLDAGPPTAYLDGIVAPEDAPAIDVEQAAAFDGARDRVVLDVRRISEYALAHIPGSVWISRGDLERRIHDRATPETTICVVSDRGLRARYAAATLIELGYPRAVHLAGGMAAWRASGRRTVEGLDGAEIDLVDAKHDFQPGAERPRELAPDHGDMTEYLQWEEALLDDEPTG